ncbi:MAG: hypothetical protein WC568_00050 [Candidatus Methanoperedens sp.]
MNRTILKKLVICLLVVSFYYIPYVAAEEMSTPFDVTPVIRRPYLNPDDKGAEIEFILQNKQESAIDNVRVYLFLQPPFSASRRSVLEKEMNLDYIIGTGVNEDLHTRGFVLGTGQMSKTRFKIDVDKNARYGYYELPYTIYYDYNGAKTYAGTVKVRIAGNTLIEIADVTIDKKEIKPGDNFRINISLRNAGDNEIQWVKVALLPEDAGIIPFSSASERVFNDFPSKLQYTASFDFSIDKGIPPRNYLITVSLSYQDENGAFFNETKTTGVKVIDNSNLDIASIKTDPQRIYAGENVILTIRIENNGQGDAKSVKSEINIPLKGEKTAFLGTIKSDEDAPAVYALKTEESGEINYNLRITHKDDRGEHIKDQPLTLVVYPRNANNTPFIFLGALVIPAYLYWRKKNRKSKKPVE